MNIPLLKMPSFSVQAKRIVPRDTEVLGCFCSLRHGAPTQTHGYENTYF